MISNKKIGTEFEREFCELLAQNGYWTHFINPDRTGAQPFDVIAVRHGIAYAIDCKTCDADTFNISRLEPNQHLAFSRWMRCGNEQPIIAVKHDGVVKLIWYNDLVKYQSIKLRKVPEFRPDKSILKQRYRYLEVK